MEKVRWHPFGPLNWTSNCEMWTIVRHKHKEQAFVSYQTVRYLRNLMKIAGFILTLLGIFVFLSAVTHMRQSATPAYLLGYFAPSLVILAAGIFALTCKSKKKQ